MKNGQDNRNRKTKKAIAAAEKWLGWRLEGANGQTFWMTKSNGKTEKIRGAGNMIREVITFLKWERELRNLSRGG